METTGDIHILVVDDEDGVRKYLQFAIDAAGYRCSVASEGEEAMRLMEQDPVDVVVTDIRMPGLNGMELLQYLNARYDADLIVMTGLIGEHTYEEIINSGASDFVEKPMKASEMILRLKRVLRERTLLKKSNFADKRLAAAHNELKESYLDTIQRLVLAAEYKDEDTGDHIIRMSRYSALLAEKAGFPQDLVQSITYAAPMHDVGKIGIPDHILMKPGKLTTAEYEIMKTHTIIGADILANSKSEILKLAADIAVTHHEKWDGSGYPNGLSEQQIPIWGRIVGLADVFDALTSNRPYKKPYPIEAAMNIIMKQRRLHFDPDLVDILLKSLDDFRKIRDEVGSLEDVRLSDFTVSARDRSEKFRRSGVRGFECSEVQEFNSSEV